MISPLLLIKPMILCGLGSWLGIACFNNIVDRATNRFLLHNMFSMEQLKADESMGQGLLSRAWDNRKLSHAILWGVVVIQAVLATSFMVSAGLFITALIQQSYLEFALTIANASLFGFMCLWLWFLCGGLWFGYWIKMSQVQTTHLMLLMLGLLATIVINIF